MQRNNIKYTQTFVEELYNALAQRTLQALPAEEIYPKSVLLQTHKNRIIQRVFLNLGLTLNQALTEEQREAVKKEFPTIIYMISGLPSFFKNGDELETPAEDGHDKYEILARNFLRFFMRGSKVAKENDWLWNSPVFMQELYDTIQISGHPELLFYVREEIQAYANAVYNFLIENDVDSSSAYVKSQVELAQIHLGPLLAAMAFFNYQEEKQVIAEEKQSSSDNAKLEEDKQILNAHTMINVPVRLKNVTGQFEWHQIKYRIEKLDISPHPTDGGLDGIIGWLLSEEDRFYMYGLNPVKNDLNAPPILLFNGTPYPGVPGEPLADIHNFGIDQSVGESHNLTAVRNWIEKYSQTKILSYGHSKGGSIGQVLAVEYPHQLEPQILNSPGLEDATLARIEAKQNNDVAAIEIVSYRQTKNGTKDPVSRIGKFLPGTKSRHVLVDDNGPSLNAYPIPSWYANVLESHSFPILGYKNVLILNGNAERENQGKLRNYLTSFKRVYNYFASTQGKLNLIINLSSKHVHAFCDKHKKLLSNILFCVTATAIITAITLSTFGVGGVASLAVLLAKALPISANVATSLSFLVAGMGAMVASAALTYANVIPKIAKAAGNLVLAVANKAFTLVGLTTSLVLTLPSAIKNGTSALYRNPQPLADLAVYIGSLQFIVDLVSLPLNIFRAVAKIGYIAGAATVKYLSSLKSTNHPAVVVKEPLTSLAVSDSTTGIYRGLNVSQVSLVAQVAESKVNSDVRADGSVSIAPLQLVQSNDPVVENSRSLSLK